MMASHSPPRVSRNTQASDQYIAIGIDFGTTYSGAAWAYSQNPQQINDVCSWPSLVNRSYQEEKFPTYYDISTKRKSLFGAKENNETIRWFKLLLLKDEDIPTDIRESEYLQDARKKLREHPVYQADGVVDLVARFLGDMWGVILKDINKAMSEDVVDNLPLRIAITVPAIWPSYARQKMKQAAERAGILSRKSKAETTLVIVEEPEAAALCTFFERRNYPDIEVSHIMRGASPVPIPPNSGLLTDQVGEAFVVCDCGGGTADIISYTVTKTEPFQIEEAVKGDGKLCGAVLIDEEFEKYMIYNSGLKFINCKPDAFRRFVNDVWEYTLKRRFSGDEPHDTFMIRPPAKVFSVYKRAFGVDSFPLERDVVEGFYSDTYAGIRTLIGEQVQGISKKLGKDPKKILLVGGLGGSPYLYRRLQEQYPGKVLQPKHVWTAVARGAVISILKNRPASISKDPEMTGTNCMPLVASRVARLSYGVEFGQNPANVSPKADDSKDRFYHTPDGRKWVKRMRWYLKQNQSVNNRKPVQYVYNEWFLNPEALASASLRILTSDSEEPPCRRDESVKELCTIGYTIDTPWDKLEKIKHQDGSVSCRVDGLRLEMKFEGEPKWALSFEGKIIEQAVDVQYAGI